MTTDNHSQHMNSSAQMHGQGDMLRINPNNDRLAASVAGFAQTQDTLMSDIPNGEMPYQPGLSWTGDTNDMNWLSLVPFWDDFEHGSFT
jgi:hypothetical protein